MAIATRSHKKVDCKMNGQVSWETNVQASVQHAVWAMIEYRTIVDKALQAELTPVVRRMPERQSSDSLFTDLFTGFKSTTNPEIAGADEMDILADAKRVMLNIYPNLSESLRLRMRPIREQWEARGPGLMSSIANLMGYKSSSEMVPNIILVHPVLGGAAHSLPSHHALVFEAVLANSFPELPEVLRLAWGLTQLFTYRMCQSVNFECHQSLCEIATIPPTLAAGEIVELCRFEKTSLHLALDKWCGSQRFDTDTVWNWWNDHNHSNAWPDRLIELQKVA